MTSQYHNHTMPSEDNTVTPYPTPNQTAQQLVEDSPHFRWRAGMRLIDGKLHTFDTRRPRDPDAIPDLSDPGTVGHLLHLYRRAIEDHHTVLEVLTNAPNQQGWAVVDGDGHVRSFRPTEGCAVAAALLALDPPRTAPTPQPPPDDPERQVSLFPDFVR